MASRIDSILQRMISMIWRKQSQVLQACLTEFRGVRTISSLSTQELMIWKSILLLLIPVDPEQLLRLFRLMVLLTPFLREEVEVVPP